MKNVDVCNAFVNGSHAKSLSMHVSCDGDKIYSYATVIGQKIGNGTILLNATKYSVTTSKHQHHLRYALIGSAFKVVETTKRVPIGTYDLQPYK